MIFFLIREYEFIICDEPLRVVSWKNLAMIQDLKITGFFKPIDRVDGSVSGSPILKMIEIKHESLND